MGKSRYRPVEPLPLHRARIDVRQTQFEGPWHIILTEPCDDWRNAAPVDLGSFPDVEAARAHAINLERVPEERVFVSAPIRGIVGRLA